MLERVIRMSLILVLGLSGVGKTFVCSKAIEILKKKRKKFQIVNYGDIISKITKKDKDFFRIENSKKQYTKIQFDSAKRIVKDYNNKDILLTTHALMNTKYGFVFGLPPKVLDILRPDLILVLWMEPKRVFYHVQKDKENTKRKFREELSLEHIKQMQELERVVCVQYGFYCDCPVKFVENVEGKADTAAQEISRSIFEALK